MPGAGMMPCGTGPCGGASPAALADQAPSASRAWLIDIGTATYVVDPNGEAVGMDGTRQIVQLIMQNTRRQMPNVVAADLEAQRRAYTTALQDLVKDGSIANLVVTVAAEPGRPGGVRTKASYTNLGTSLPQTVTVP